MVSLTLLPAICADYSRNGDAHLLLFHLSTKWIVFCCWTGCEKSIGNCFQHFTAVKSGNYYRSSFSHFIPHCEKLGWRPYLSPLLSFWGHEAGTITLQWFSPFKKKHSQLWALLQAKSPIWPIVLKWKSLAEILLGQLGWGPCASKSGLEVLIPFSALMRDCWNLKQDSYPLGLCSEITMFLDIAARHALGYKEKWWAFARNVIFFNLQI